MNGGGVRTASILSFQSIAAHTVVARSRAAKAHNKRFKLCMSIEQAIILNVKHDGGPAQTTCYHGIQQHDVLLECLC